jgi:hypothetical protein
MQINVGYVTATVAQSIWLSHRLDDGGGGVVDSRQR